MLVQQCRKALSSYYATDLRRILYAGNEADGLMVAYHLSTESSTLYLRGFLFFNYLCE